MKLITLSAFAGMALVAASFLPAAAQLPHNPRSVLPQNFPIIKQGEYNQIAVPEITFPDFYDVEVERFYHEDALLLDPTLVYPVSGPMREDVCRNGDFEAGIDPNEWSGGYGSINSSGIIQYNTFANGIVGGPINQATSRQTLVNYALDPNAPIYTTPGPTSLRAVRIGNAVNGWGSELLSKTFTVTSAKSLINFSYALVLQSPGHSSIQQPAFRVRVIDASTGVEILGVTDLGNGSNVAIANTANPFFQTTANGTIVYRDWTCAQINLTNHVGRRVTIQFVTNDCAQGGHWGYAYIDNICGDCGGTGYNLQLNKVDCDKNTVCVKYQLPKVNNITGSVKLTLYLYQNGILKDSVVSPTLTSDSLYCFTVNTSQLDPSLGGYDFTIRGNFAISGQSLAPLQLYTAPNGSVSGVNNDCIIRQAPLCCPGTNILINGGFEQGNTGFTSQYTYQPTIASGSVTPGRYSILTDAQAATVSSTWLPNCTTYNKHFVANGVTGGSGWKAVWQQAIAVKAGKTYKFCGDFKNLPQCGFDVKPVIGMGNGSAGYATSPSQIQTINITGGTCNWQRVEYTITATSNTIYLSIFLLETGVGDGNDVAMDNLSLIELQPVSASDVHFNRTVFNMTSTTYNISITPVTALPSDCKHFWEVEELDANYLVIASTQVVDPPSWQSLSTNTFIGYVGTSTLTGTANGLFQNSKTYRFVYGRSCSCAALTRRYEIYGPGPAFKSTAGSGDEAPAGEPMLLEAGILDEDGKAIPSTITKEPEDARGIKVYPNPTSGKVTVERPRTDAPYDVKVFNVYGQEVQSRHFGAGETRMDISLAEYAPGSYLLHIVAANGTIVHAEKVTRQ